MSNGVDRDYLVQLVNRVYQLTLLFPKKEPLRYKMRELADDILADLLRIKGFFEDKNERDFYLARAWNQTRENTFCEIAQKLNILDSYFAVAKEQKWVSFSDILALQEEYVKINESLKKVVEEEKVKSPQEELVLEVAEAEEKEEQVKEEKNQVFTTRRDLRQEKILEVLKDKGKAQVWEIQKILPNVTKRTLRRDFRDLLEQDLIERIGERNETFYKLKSR